MARREKERYTERARPKRQASAASGAKSASGSNETTITIGNPVVIIALVMLIIGALLASYAILRRGSGATTAAGTPTGAATPPAEGTVVGAATGEAAGATTGAAGEAKTFSAAEDQQLDPANTAYFATIATARGPIVVELWPELAPQHVNSFIFLARQGYFDGLSFHRVEPGFVIQGGDPEGTGSGGPGYSLPGEFNADNPVPHRAGTLAMARTTDPNSAGSQFYIVLEDSPTATNLDGQYTVFGHVTSGMDAVRAVQRGDLMTAVTIEEKPKSESAVSPDDIRQGQLPQNG